MPIGARLREERERLGMSQPAFAAIAATTKQTLFSWETGKTAPDGFQLSVLAGAGVDVMFVLSGTRNASALSADEATVLQYYREATPAVRRAALGALIGAVPGASAQTQRQGNVTLSDLNQVSSQAGSVQVGYAGGGVKVTTQRGAKKTRPD